MSLSLEMITTDCADPQTLAAWWAEAVGGKILWSTETSGAPIVGCDHDAYDEVVAVWYPSRAAFVRLPEQPGYTEALEHRDAALEQAVLLPCEAFDEQRLGTPWDG